jgi:hypothetical protein
MALVRVSRVWLWTAKALARSPYSMKVMLTSDSAAGVSSAAKTPCSARARTAPR